MGLVGRSSLRYSRSKLSDLLRKCYILEMCLEMCMEISVSHFRWKWMPYFFLCCIDSQFCASQAFFFFLLCNVHVCRSVFLPL